MAKDKVVIPSISISNSKPGMAYGGVIYSASANVGYDAEPTKLTLNVVLDTELSGGKRDFVINKNHLDLTSPVDIDLGSAEKDGRNKMFQNMFLHSYSMETAAGSKTMSLTYVDGSAVLSRIFVGLIHEHFQVYNSHMVPNMVEFDVLCPKTELVNVNGKITPICSDEGSKEQKRKTLRNLASPSGVPGRPYQVFKQDKRKGARGLWAGGYMALGREEFNEVACDIKDVSYGFEDFLSALEDKANGFGITIDRSRYIMTKDSNLLLRSYTGTAKDVLQNWGNDLSISYYWDFTKKKPTLAIISNADRSVDKKVEVAASKIDALDRGQRGGNDKRDATDLVINSKSESVTLDGTFTQAFSSIFGVGSKADAKNKKKTTQTYFSCQPVSSIVNYNLATAEKIGSGRHPNDIKIACGLGKYSKDLRDIWCTRKAIAVHMDKAHGPQAAAGYYKALGYSDVVPLTYRHENETLLDKESRVQIHDWLNTTQILAGAATNRKNVSEAAEGLHDYHMFVGIYDDSIHNTESSAEQEIANGFIGKHYLLGAPKSEDFYFDGSKKMKLDVSTQPSSTYYSYHQHYKSPMTKFIKKISDLYLNRALSTDNAYQNKLYDTVNKMKFDILKECDEKAKNKVGLYKEAYKKGFFHFERNAPWACFQEDVDSLLNPHELQMREPLNKPEIGIVFHKGTQKYGDSTKGAKDRVKTNCVKEFIPFRMEVPMIMDIVESMPSKIKAMMASGEATNKKVVVCIVKINSKEAKPPPKKGKKKRSLPDFNLPAGLSGIPGDVKTPLRIGRLFPGLDAYLEIAPNFKRLVDSSKGLPANTTIGGMRNPIEEINALSTICDRNVEGMQNAVEDMKTTCERDFTEELCAQTNFGQKDTTCGEAEVYKDSLYDTELTQDIRKTKSTGFAAGGIYADAIKLTRVNVNAPVSYVGTAKQKLWSDERFDLTDSNVVNIIYPSENNNNARILYNRDTTVTDQGVRKVFDAMNEVRVPVDKRASVVKYQTKDITQDITSLINDEVKTQIKESNIPTNIVADIENLKPLKDGSLTYTQMQSMSALVYHQRLRGNINNLQVHEPRKSYSYKLYISEPVQIKKLLALLKPENGLESVSISIDEGGFYISISLSNRASADINAPWMKDIYNKVGPIARETSRKFPTIRSA